MLSIWSESVQGKGEARHGISGEDPINHFQSCSRNFSPKYSFFWSDVSHGFDKLLRNGNRISIFRGRDSNGEVLCLRKDTTLRIRRCRRSQNFAAWHNTLDSPGTQELAEHAVTWTKVCSPSLSFMDIQFYGSPLPKKWMLFVVLIQKPTLQKNISNLTRVRTPILPSLYVVQSHQVCCVFFEWLAQKVGIPYSEFLNFFGIVIFLLIWCPLCVIF